MLDSPFPPTASWPNSWYLILLPFFADGNTPNSIWPNSPLIGSLMFTSSHHFPMEIMGKKWRFPPRRPHAPSRCRPSPWFMIPSGQCTGYHENPIDHPNFHGIFHDKPAIGVPPILGNPLNGDTVRSCQVHTSSGMDISCCCLSPSFSSSQPMYSVPMLIDIIKYLLTSWKWLILTKVPLHYIICVYIIICYI